MATDVEPPRKGLGPELAVVAVKRRREPPESCAAMSRSSAARKRILQGPSLLSGLRDDATDLLAISRSQAVCGRG